MAKKNITYQEAINEVEEIIERIESEELDVDELSQKVKRVSELINICKEKLHNTEKDIEQVLSKIDDADTTE